MMRKTKIIIVGQGLAGTLLSYHFHKQHIPHLIVDQPQDNTASKVAAGLINPIGIKRMVKSWNVDQFLPYAKTIYSEIEQLVGRRFFHPMAMNKIFGEKDQEFWQHRLRAGALHDYIQTDPASKSLPAAIKTPYGFGLILQGGRLDMPRFLQAYRTFLKHKGLLVEDEFSEDAMTISAQGVQWQSLQGERIIFCRGEKDSVSPLFRQLNFRNTKGQLLNARIKDLTLDGILLKGIFVLPSGSRFKIGATFEHQWPDMAPTMAMRRELLEKWSAISDLPLEIDDQLTGIRPTMHDRRPVIGFLPQQQRIGIFNGLGSRGGLIAPFLANELSRMLLTGTSHRFPEVAVERYFR